MSLLTLFIVFRQADSKWFIKTNNERKDRNDSDNKCLCRQKSNPSLCVKTFMKENGNWES
jgi:hypothetical protein